MSELTILYVSSNREPWLFEKRIIKTLLENCGDLPIISVTQKPINLGRNICVGDVGASGFNMFRQVEIGCSEAKTTFVISAEADCLYPREYFKFIPPEDNIFYRNTNCYLVPCKRDFFWKKSSGATWSQVVGKKHYLNTLGRLFKKAPDWNVEELNFPKERKKRSDITTDDIEFYETEFPCISFKSGMGMRHFSTTQERTNVYELPYWGHSKKLRKKYLGNI